MFKLLGRFVGRFWWLVLLGWAVACALSVGAPKLSQVGVDDSVDFLSDQSDAVRARRLLIKAFPKDVYQSSAVVVVESAEAIGPDQAELVTHLSIAIRQLAQRPLYHLDIGIERTPPPFAAPVEPAAADVPEDASGPLRGSYRYCWLYAQHDARGRAVGRSECAPVTVVEALDGRAVRLSGIADSPDPSVTHKELYRTKADDPTTFFLLDTIPQGTDTYVDRKTDLALGAEPGLFTPFIERVTDFTDPIVGERFYVSQDRRATIIQIAMDSYWLATRTLVTCRHLRGLVRERVAGWRDARRAAGKPGLDVKVYTTGYAAVGQDYIREAGSSVDNTEKTTYLMVVLILLIVYRSPLLAVIPLVTVGVSVFCSWAVLAEFALLAQALDFEFKVINITDIFVIVILFGAGTDYCLFLIARARERLELGRPVRSAVAGAVGSVGGALAASAGTVICGLGMMIFGEFAKYRYTGPAVAISLVVGLCAALTLAPSLLCLFGRSAFWTPLNRRTWLAVKRTLGLGSPDEPLERRDTFWDRVSHRLVQRPGLILSVCLLVMLPFGLLGMDVDVSYDLLEELPSHKEAVLGINVIRDHFPIGEMDSIKLLLGGEDSHVDFRTPQAKQAVADLSDRLAGFDGVAGVRSLSRPLGEPEPLAPAPKPKTRGALFGLFGKLADGIADRARQVKQQYYISSEGELAGRVTRIDVVLDQEPFTLDAMAKLEAIRELVGRETARPDSPLRGVDFSFAGATGVTNDLRRVTERDDRRIRVLVVIGIFVILVVLLRKVGVSLYLILSVVFSYYVTLGVTRLVFNVALGYPGLHWTVPFFLFVLLVAVGEDYNIFLMARVEEESRRHGPIEGTRLAVARTGAIITSCGLIMAGTFGSMLTGTLSALIELGFALTFGVLLDTFVVRPILVPTFLLVVHRLLGRH